MFLNEISTKGNQSLLSSQARTEVSELQSHKNKYGLV